MRVLAAFVYFYQWYMKVSKKGGTPKSSASIILFSDFPLWTYCGVPWCHHFRKFQKMTCASPPQLRRKMPAEWSAAVGIASSTWFAKKMVGLQQNMETFSLSATKNAALTWWMNYAKLWFWRRKLVIKANRHIDFRKKKLGFKPSNRNKEMKNV